jgi:hypothetical protein
MGNARILATRQPDTTSQVHVGKRVILSMGGKGGVGKTNVMGGLAEWFATNRIPVTLPGAGPRRRPYDERC